MTTNPFSAFQHLAAPILLLFIALVVPYHHDSIQIALTCDPIHCSPYLPSLFIVPLGLHGSFPVTAMGWFRSPFSSRKHDPSSDAETRLLTSLNPPTTSLSRHQIFYLLGLNGIGGGIISGGINFAIAYGLLPPPFPLCHRST